MNIDSITMSLVQTAKSKAEKVQILIAVARLVGGDPIKLIIETVSNKIENLKSASGAGFDDAIDELVEFLTTLKEVAKEVREASAEPAILETIPATPSGTTKQIVNFNG